MPTTTTVPAARRDHRRTPEPSTARRMVERCLLARAAAGDVRALDRLFALHRPHLLATAQAHHPLPGRRRGRGPGRAGEDLAHGRPPRPRPPLPRAGPPWWSAGPPSTTCGPTPGRGPSPGGRRGPAEACPFAAVDDRLDATRLIGDLAGREDDRRLLTWIHVDGESLERHLDPARRPRRHGQVPQRAGPHPPRRPARHGGVTGAPPRCRTAVRADRRAPAPGHPTPGTRPPPCP